MFGKTDADRLALLGLEVERLKEQIATRDREIKRAALQYLATMERQRELVAANTALQEQVHAMHLDAQKKRQELEAARHAFDEAQADPGAEPEAAYPGPQARKPDPT